MEYAEIYPDIMTAGGLVPAIVNRAEELGVSWVPDRAGIGCGTSAEAEIHTDNGDLRINTGYTRRAFMVELWRNGSVWLSGTTAELDDIVTFADAWHQGTSLTDAVGHWPFLQCDRLARAHEEGNAVPAKWELLTRGSELEVMRELVSVAHSRTELRRLFPWVSHHGTCLRFSRCTGYPFTLDTPYIEITRDTLRVISGPSGELLRRVLLVSGSSERCGYRATTRVRTGDQRHSQGLQYALIEKAG